MVSGAACSAPLTVRSRAFGMRQDHLCSDQTIILTTTQQEGRPLERHHCRFLHRWCSRRPWWLQGHAQRCHRLRHPARRHRGCRYRFPAHDGRKHQTRRTPTTSARHRGCSQAHGRLKKRRSITCVIYGYIRRLERKASFLFDLWGCLLFSPIQRPASHEGDCLLFTLRNHVQISREEKRPWWS